MIGDSQIENLLNSYVTIMLITAFVCFLVSEITRNYSQVDKLWSIMPIIYCIIALINHPSPRMLIMSLLVCLWGFRLSYNFYRKGGYNIIPWKGEEDYRWKIMRENPLLRGRFRFGLFNFFFISFYQHFLILLFCSPLLIVSKYQNTDFNLIDLIASVLILIFIIVETIADNQQFRFQTLKRQPGENPGIYKYSLEQGFLSAGLWRFVRHPNYLSEQAIWLSFYFFGAAASGMIFNWTLTGAVLLILLFQGSTMFTEALSNKKYPEYSEYKKRTPKFLPKVFDQKIKF